MINECFLAFSNRFSCFALKQSAFLHKTGQTAGPGAAHAAEPVPGDAYAIAAFC